MRSRLYVFGSNGEGQLGIPAKDIIDTPTAAESWPPHGGIKSVRSGDNHTLILDNFGKVWGAGDNRKGQLGCSSALPSRMEAFKELRSTVYLHAATCETSAYITNNETSYPQTNSTLITEGTSQWGELGLGANINKTSTSKESNEQPLSKPTISFAAGVWHYVLVDSNSAVYGWGKSRLDQLGPKLSTHQRIPTPTCIEEDIGFMPTKVVCGKDFTYLAGEPEHGSHVIFGRDKFGIRSNMPPHINNWKDIGATWHSIFVLFQDGNLTAWGKDNMWKLVPDDLPPIDQMAVGSEHVLALTRDHKLISWGWGKHGNCGDLTTLAKEGKVANDMLSNCWNEITVPGRVRFVGAGFCTSFVLCEVEADA